MTQADAQSAPIAPRPQAKITCARCRRKIRLTSSGTFYAHKPYTRQFSGEMVPYCKASGMTPEWARRPVVSPGVESST